MPNKRHSHPKPPKSAFKSSYGDLTVDQIQHEGRAYTIHPTKGWRSRNVDKLMSVNRDLAWWLRL